jgi:hypothetical protein
MRTQKLAIALTAAVALLANIGVVQAKEVSSADMLVYISPDEYTHSNRLSHYNFREYWYEQGPVVEPYVAEILGTELGKVGLCEAGETGNTLVWLKPDMTYNATLRTFNGKVTAQVYSGSGKALGTYVGESRRNSNLDIVPAYQVNEAYKAAMHNLADKMKADEALQTAMKTAVANDEKSTPCAMLPLLPVAKKSNSLLDIFK